MNRSGIRAVIFDLDGTLVDSLPGIEASLSAALGRCLPGRSLPELRSVIGPPVRVMLEKLLPELSGSEIDAIVAEFRQHYDREGCLQSRLYEGVAATLRALEQNGIAMFVLTNKPLRPALRILEALRIAQHFRAVVSPDSSDPPYPVKSEGAARLQSDYALASSSTLVVGDGIDDADAAAKCGFRFAAAAYGYGNVAARQGLEPVAVLKNFSELARAVL